MKLNKGETYIKKIVHACTEVKQFSTEVLQKTLFKKSLSIDFMIRSSVCGKLNKKKKANDIDGHHLSY